MSFARIKETFLRLPWYTQGVIVGALVLGISALLPWYADVDSYKIGDEFLGVTGPTSFMGIAILLMSGVSLWISSYHITARHMPKLPVREGVMQLFIGIESLFLLFVTNSIFFHPSFGVNITLKESRFGMTFAVIAAILLTVGAYMQNKNEIEGNDAVGRLEPLIKIDDNTTPGFTSTNVAAQRTHSNVTERTTGAVARSESAMRGFGYQAPAEKMGVREERSTEEDIDSPQKPRQPMQRPMPKPYSGSTMIRMDL